MAVTFSDLPYGVLESIMLNLARIDPKCFWHASRVDKEMYKITRNLLSSQRHGQEVAKHLVERGLPFSDQHHVFQLRLRLQDHLSFDFHHFLMQFMRWRVIATPPDGVKKQIPKKVANILDIHGLLWPIVDQSRRHGDKIFIYNEDTKEGFSTTLDLQQAEFVKDVDHMNPFNFQLLSDFWKKKPSEYKGTFVVPKVEGLEIVVLSNRPLKMETKGEINTMPYFNSPVTCAFMNYGTLILGTELGEIFAYHVVRYVKTTLVQSKGLYIHTCAGFNRPGGWG